MGSKKHKKHKSERREKYEDQPFSLERPPSLKLILKVGTGNSSTPEYASSESPPVYGGIQPESLGLLMDYPERHKKSKKKKKKKDREKKHKHHKEKRRHLDESRDRTENEQDESSQEDFSINEDSAQFQSDSTLRYNPVLSDSASPASISVSQTPLLLLPLKSPILDSLASEQSPSMSSVRSDSLKSPSSTSDSGARTCVIKMRQKPLSKLLSHLLSLLEKKDPQQFFAWPVSDDIAPGYSNIITNPMDFFTIRSKIEDSKYQTLIEFIDDFKLICMNAIQYNQEDTVYHIAAKKLLHVGLKMLKPGNLIRLKPLQIYLQELSTTALGFDVSQGHHYNDLHMMVDSADESMSTGVDEVNIAQLEEEVKRQNIRLENEPQSRFEPFLDDLTSEEILAQVQDAAAKAKKKISERKRANKMGFLRHKKDGTTSMQILVDIENSCPERIVSIGAFTGKLQSGTGQIQSFREDRRNNAKIVKPLNYGTYCSFAPIYDSRFSNLSKEEVELVLNTYGDEANSEYAASIIEFTKYSQHGSFLANAVLDFLTNGEHRKTMATLSENSRQKFEHSEVQRTFPNPTVDDEYEKYKDTKIDFDVLRTLSDVGVNIDFLSEMEEDVKTFEIYKSLENRLENNSELLGRLRQVQNERLSQNLPTHLSNVAHPSEDELELATQITNNLKEIAKELPPSSLVSASALRKAMGISNVGLEPLTGFQGNKNISPNDKSERNTAQITMDIDANTSPDDIQNTVKDASTLPSVDLESELREFLESDPTSLAAAAADDVGIDQMLMA
ncbi:bromodomain-containing protein 7 [Contarinia nasturtii]|uniref:bromodomain-containing protein 7 n=1 Tax=Contarinia nasturtii TaxID=265458 RepID=UPI0012D3D476|nr:bromodomain-containing protein 7 [Contarinia nasturtii]